MVGFKRKSGSKSTSNTPDGSNYPSTTASALNSNAPSISSSPDSALHPPYNPNPFSTPPYSRSPSTYGGMQTGFQYADVPGTRYFRSRRVKREDAIPIPPAKKTKKDALLWVFPLCGLILGIGICAVLVYFKLKGFPMHTYCPVLSEDFSSGSLDTDIWSYEIQSGGFGNGQFEQTTDSPENTYVQDGKLYLKPTLQDEKLLTTNNVINLTALGTCTSDTWWDCVTSTNTTNGTIVQPILSSRINTKKSVSIKYGKVEVKAKIPKGDWLWPAIWMMPKDSVYGAWPASGEIDIMEARGNNYSYSLGGNNFFSSALHWGTSGANDAYLQSVNRRSSLHSQFGDQYHTYGMEWNEKYIFTYVDNVLQTAMYWYFNTQSMWQRGSFSLINSNGSALVNPWAATNLDQTPFDQEFFLIINLAVGGTNGWFLDGADDKPWVDAVPTAKTDFWKAKDQWYPTWEANNGGAFIIDEINMWQQC